YTRVNARPVLRFTFTDRIDRSTVPESVSFSKSGGTVVSFRSSLTDDDKTLVVEPEAQLTAFTKYTVTLSTALKSELNLPLTNAISASLTTGIDSSDKFPRISADELMTLVQEQTFRYF